MVTNTADAGSESFKPNRWRQLLAAIISTNGAFSLGLVLAWPSPSISELIANKQLGEISITQSSWIASLTLLGAAISAIPAGYAIERIGRRQTLILLGIPLFLGWIVIAFSDSVRMLCLGRFITGLTAGACSLVVPVYLSEIASDKHRGRISSLFSLQIVHGILFVYIHAVLVADWMNLSLAAAIPALIMSIGMYFMPESPVFLLTSEKVEEATKALMWLRGANQFCQVETEINSLQSNAKELAKAEKINFKSMSRAEWLPLGISVAFMIFRQWSGRLIAISFTAPIFEKAGLSSLSPNVSAIIVGVTQYFGIGMSGLLIDRLGRRVLLISSGVLVAICWVPLGIAFKLQEQNGGVMPAAIQIIPLICLVGFIVVFSLGLGPIPWMLPSELLPTNVRGQLGSVALTMNWLPAFVLVKTFDSASISLGVYTCFWFFAAVSLTAAIFTYFLLPETKGRSAEEIRGHFQNFAR